MRSRRLEVEMGACHHSDHTISACCETEIMCEDHNHDHTNKKSSQDY